MNSPSERAERAEEMTDALETNALNADFVSAVPTKMAPPALSNAETFIDRLEVAAKAAPQEPWSTCNKGCPCGFISTADNLVATVAHGKWGDTYPAIRLVGESSFEMRAEPYIEMIEYGEVSPEVALANAAHIAAFDPPTALKLLAVVRAALAWHDAEADGDVKELEADLRLHAALCEFKGEPSEGPSTPVQPSNGKEVLPSGDAR